MDEPGAVSRRRRAALLDQIVSRAAKQRVHQHAPVHHRLGSRVLVDAPRSRDHANVLRIQHIHRQRTGVDIEHAADYR
ncbi:hypothetical protein, partial [uncultured Mailhella sp.]|uniref:hypothetical protein n=1 Tax=uncultured Mailhella sp. TaxID=1981031 RepID=UPI0025E66E7F